MGRIRLTGATSGFTELRAANAAGNNTITLPTTTGGEVIVSDSSGNVNIDSGTFYVDASNNRVGIGTTVFPASTPIQVKAVGAGSGGYAIVSANDENAGGIILNASSENSVRIEADPGNLRASSYINLSVDGNERARIDSSGRLLVGTSTSATTGDAQYAKVQIRGNTFSANEWGLLALMRDDAATTGYSAGNVIGGITFADSTGARFASFQAAADGATGSNDYPGRLVFSTTADGASSPTERMRIGSGGGVNLFSPSGISLAIGSTLAAGTTNYFIVAGHSASSVGVQTNVFLVYTNGNVINANNSYGAISDIKLKENIVDANSQWDDIKSLQVRKYNFKEDQTHTQIGLVAQEVELVSPGLVSESPDRDADGNDLGTVTKSVNYSVFYMKAVKALQEAMERIEQLEAEMAAVKTQLS